MNTKKLIEVALPLEKINEESAREKSIRHGHPSTLHLWWARRPLAAARAVIWASLVDDPSSHPELFPTEAEQQKERQRLFSILEELVVWENSNNKEVLQRAYDEIVKSTNGNIPDLLDPFSGGGAIPLEAQRLGLNVHANDLNPISVMINKAMIEIPPKYANSKPINPEDRLRLKIDNWTGTRGLAADVKFYGDWIKQEAYNSIGHLYPKIKDSSGQEYTVIAWIWSRTVVSPNPLAHGAHVPLISSKMLSTKKGNKAWVEIVADSKAPDGWKFKVCTGEITTEQEKEMALGTKAGKAQDFICCLTNTPIKREYIQEEGKAGRLSKRLMAIVALGKNGRLFFAPTAEHERIALDEDQNPDNQEARNTFLSGSTPTRAMVTGGVCSAYGLSTWGDLFTGRQIRVLTTFSRLVKEAQKKVIADGGDEEYAKAIGVYLAFAIDKLVDINSSACGWITANGVIRNTFARQAIPMVWDYTEANPFSTSSGCFDLIIEKITECISDFPAKGTGIALQKDAQSDNGLRNVMVSTDPPYYDNIAYAILSDFFYVWMRETLKDSFPNIFNTVLTPKAEELVVSPYRFDGGIQEAKSFFENGMFQVFTRIFDYSCDDIPVTVYYAYKQSESGTEGVSSSGWETMLSAIIHAGFSITGTWPMRTERGGRMIDIGANALASSIVLVCRKRPQESSICTRRNFVNELKRELRPALKNLQSSNIAPVDLAQSAIGPGIGVYSKYTQVLEANGEPMTVRSALQIINQELDLYFNEQDSDLDTESRFCVELYSQCAFNDIAFGDANILATAKNTSVVLMASHGILFAQKGVVHLVDRSELSGKISEHDGSIWLLCQQLTYIMEKDGVEGCAKAISGFYGSKSDIAKDLAYRLFTIADKKNWTQEAYAYNSLVVAWPEIQSRASELRSNAPQQLSLDEYLNAEKE